MIVRLRFQLGSAKQPPKSALDRLELAPAPPKSPFERLELALAPRPQIAELGPELALVPHEPDLPPPAPLELTLDPPPLELPAQTAEPEPEFVLPVHTVLERLEQALLPPQTAEPEPEPDLPPAPLGLELTLDPPPPEFPAHPQQPAVQMAQPAVEPPLFAGFITDRRPRVPALLISLAGHVLAVVLVTTISARIQAYLAEDQVDWSRYHVEPLRLNLAEPIYFTPESHASAPKPKPARPVEPVGGLSASARAAAASPAAGRQSLVPKQLQLPAPRQTATNAPVILQPEVAPQHTPPPVTLPPVAFWARQAPDLPKPPAPGKDVTPGRTEAPSPAARPVAPPVLAVPNREPVLADINVAMPPKQTPAPPALPVANSATVPVHMRNVTESHAASFDPMAGEAVNVVALGPDLRDQRKVEIPRGLQNIPDTSAGDRNAPAKDGDGAAEGRAKAGSGPSQTNAGSGSSSQSKSGNVGAGTAAPGGSNARAAAAGRGGAASSNPAVERGKNPSSTIDRGAAPAAAPTRPTDDRDVTRIQHTPNGTFDVVIMQSATRDDLPDLGGMLSGTPVYTVYLRVGDRKEWLLEYCVPVREAVQANPYQVNIDDEGAVTPPYPISTVIPNSILSQQIPKHIVVHGTLTSAGSLRVTKVLDVSGPFMTDLAALLSQWQFRPALRNKRAIDVEVLLVIPPHA